MEAGTAALLRVLWAACCFCRIPTKGEDCLVPVIACVVRISCSTFLSVLLVPGVCRARQNFYKQLQAVKYVPHSPLSIRHLHGLAAAALLDVLFTPGSLLQALGCTRSTRDSQ